MDFSGAKLGSISLTDSCIWPKCYMGVSKNRGTPKWMVYNGKPYFLMDDLGGKPTIFRNTHRTHMKLQYLLQKADKVRRVACRHSSCNFRLPQSWLKLPSWSNWIISQGRGEYKKHLKPPRNSYFMLFLRCFPKESVRIHRIPGRSH